MRAKNRNYIISLVSLSLSFFILQYIYTLRPEGRSNSRLKDFPLEMGDFKGRDIKIDERVYQLLETRDILIREYVNSQGEAVNLAIVYGLENRLAFHPPEVCFSGGGFKIIDKSRVDMPISGGKILKVNKLTMQAGSVFEIAWYWFVSQDKMTPSYYIQQLNLVWEGLRGKSRGALIRVSLLSKYQDQKDTLAREFIRRVVDILPDFL